MANPIKLPVSQIETDKIPLFAELARRRGRPDVLEIADVRTLKGKAKMSVTAYNRLVTSIKSHRTVPPRYTFGRNLKPISISVRGGSLDISFITSDIMRVKLANTIIYFDGKKPRQGVMVHTTPKTIKTRWIGFKKGQYAKTVIPRRSVCPSIVGGAFCFPSAQAPTKEARDYYTIHWTISLVIMTAVLNSRVGPLKKHLSAIHVWFIKQKLIKSQVRIKGVGA